jgi:hypothetical protein
MSFARICATVSLFVGIVSAQIPEGELESRIATVRYLPLAESARVQGDVRLRINDGAVTVLSGHPLLVPTAVESAKALAPVLGAADLDVTYHFVIVNTAISESTSRTVKRGNAVERAVLRMFGLRTEKVVVEYQCEEGVPPPNEVKAAPEGIEVCIYGRTRCLQTEAGTLVAGP